MGKIVAVKASKGPFRPGRLTGDCRVEGSDGSQL